MSGFRWITGVALFLILSAATFDDRELAMLHALDKITAEVSELRVPVGEQVRFGRLMIEVLACRVRSPIEPPESAVFLKVTDRGRDLNPTQVFRGWMFASSPTLSAMEHPIYDIWVKGCE